MTEVTFNKYLEGIMLTFKEFIELPEEALAEGHIRIWRHKKILPGVKLNFSTKGISGISVGKKGKKPLFTLSRRGGIRHSFSITKGVQYIASTGGNKRGKKGGVQRMRKGTNRRRPVKHGNIG
jgi:hypothetical protein